MLKSGFERDRIFLSTNQKNSWLLIIAIFAHNEV
jgi:hypothetical protein